VKRAHDSAYRFFPLVVHELFGLKLHPVDLATNKLFALVGRRAVGPGSTSCIAARRYSRSSTSPGPPRGQPRLGPARFHRQAVRTTRHAKPELAAVVLEGPNPMSTPWRAAGGRPSRTRARSSVRLHPSEHAGKIVPDHEIQLQSATLAALARELEAGRAYFHEGHIRGARPEIQRDLGPGPGRRGAPWRRSPSRSFTSRTSRRVPWQSTFGVKLVLTSATGFMGSAALTRLLRERSVTQVTCLTRRPVERSDPRVRNAVLSDFQGYDPSLAGEFADHQGCIWTLGGKAVSIAVTNLKRVTYGFALSFARAVMPRAAGRFTLCYVSALGADRTETAWFPWASDTRHLKGRTERDLRELTPESVLCLRPGGILYRSPGSLGTALLGRWVIGLDELVEVRSAVEVWKPPPDGLALRQVFDRIAVKPLRARRRD